MPATPLFPQLLSSRAARPVLSILQRRFLASAVAITPERQAIPLSAPSPDSQLLSALLLAVQPSQHKDLSFFMVELSPTTHALAISLEANNTWLGAICAGPLDAQLSSQDQEHIHSLLELLAHEALFLYEQETSEDAPMIATRFPEMIGRSPKLQELFRLLHKICESDSTVLIQGENGTGKELIAKAIHKNSPRRDKPFVVQNCSAFNDNLLESELFGHKRGSFTGAVQDKRGLFLAAHPGTFFLDEVGDMSPRLQVKLLRVLEEGTFLPVGETSPVHVNVRIIAATNRDLQQMVEDGTFREDLYYRLHVLHAVAPPLRDRIEDLPLLVDYFLQRNSNQHKKKKKLSSGCLELLMAYHWPGNIRELSHEIDRLWVLSGDASIIREELLSPRIFEKRKAERQTLPEAVEALERRMLVESLQRHRWNKTHVAQELDISRRNLIRKCKDYHLAPTKKR